MKVLKKLLFQLSVTFLLIISCKENKKEETGPSTVTMKEVMAIHDEVMPKLGSFGSLVGELSTKEDSTEIGLKYKSAREDLQSAHKTMMDWMRGFGDKFNSDEILNGKALTEEKQKWLEEEEVKIKALREQINKSVENAESLLNKH